MQEFFVLSAAKCYSKVEANITCWSLVSFNTFKLRG